VRRRLLPSLRVGQEELNGRRLALACRRQRVVVPDMGAYLHRSTVPPGKRTSRTKLVTLVEYRERVP
jgi:hypothetical protein